MKKKLVATLVALAAVTGLAGCTTSGTGSLNTDTPTVAPTETPTETPTEAPTEAPTEVPTETPTEAPTETPTEAPVSYGITVKENKSVKVDLSTTSSLEKETVKLTVTLLDLTQELIEVKVDGKVLEAIPSEHQEVVTLYEFVMPAKDVEVEVVTMPIERYDVVLPDAPAHINIVSNVNEAAEGEEVVLTVIERDAEHFLLKAVTLNGEKLNGLASETQTGLTTYRFLMPAENAVIALDVEEIIVTKAHKLLLGTTDNVVFDGLPTEFDAGETIEFNVSVKNGFNISKIEVLNGETPVELKGDYVSGYSFVAPDADVTINAYVVGNYYKLSLNEESYEFPGAYSPLSTKNFVYNLIDEAGTTYSYDSAAFFFKAGSKVTLTAKRQTAAMASHYYVNGIEILPLAVETPTEESKLTYEFIMPMGDVELKASIEEYSINVVVNADKGISGRIYSKDADGNEITKEKYTVGDEIYVEALNTNPEGIIIRGVGTSFEQFKSSSGLLTETKTSSETSWSDTSTYNSIKYVDENTKRFKIDGAYYSSNTYTVNLFAQELVYKEKEFVGEYESIEWYNHRNTGNSRLTINSAGIVKATSYRLEGTILELDEVSKSFTVQPKSSYDKVKTVFYNGNAAAYSYYGDNYIAEDKYFTDMYLCVKNDSTETLKYVGASFDGFDVIQVVTGEVGSEVVKAAFYINSSKKQVVVNPELVFETGKLVTDAEAKFQIKKDGAVIAKVGYPIESDPVDPSFATAKFSADYEKNGALGDLGNCHIEIQFSANNKLSLVGEDADGYKADLKDIPYSYDAATKTISFTAYNAKVEAQFNEDFSTLTLLTNIRDSSDYLNLKCTDVVLNKAVA